MDADDFAYAIAIDPSGNVYVTGEGGPDTVDYATIKYNAAGVEQWVATYNGPGNAVDRGFAIDLDAAGNVYVTGESSGAGTETDFATIKYSSSGTEQWVIRYDGPGESFEEATALALDESGNI
jgi:Beta-propeller repeat